MITSTRILLLFPIIVIIFAYKFHILDVSITNGTEVVLEILVRCFFCFFFNNYVEIGYKFRPHQKLLLNSYFMLLILMVKKYSTWKVDKK